MTHPAAQEASPLLLFFHLNINIIFTGRYKFAAVTAILEQLS
jgi:hypothetical protein